MQALHDFWAGKIAVLGADNPRYAADRMKVRIQNSSDSKFE